MTLFYRTLQKNWTPNFSSVLLLIGLIIPNTDNLISQENISSYSPPKTEEIHIYFHCLGVDYLRKETIQKFLNQKKEKLEQEGGKVFFLPLGKGNTPEEPVSFSFQSGSFLWIHSDHSDQIQYTKKYQFLFGFNSGSYKESETQYLDTPIFWVFDESLPNSYRRLGNFHAISCPKTETQIGKLKLEFRGNQIIRKHFSYSDLENWLGDL